MRFPHCSADDRAPGVSSDHTTTCPSCRHRLPAEEVIPRAATGGIADPRV